jgi:glycosyltransferase involved in cell wall biosynthesis
MIENTDKLSHIVFLCTSLDGGIGRNIIRLSEAFVERGIQVSIWLDDINTKYVQEVPDNVQIKQLATTHAILGLPQLIWRLLSETPDVVFTSNERMTRLMYYARRFSYTKTALVAHVHNFYGTAFKRLSDKKRHKRIRRLARIYPMIDAVIAVSKGVAKDFSELTGMPLEKISVIYNPVVTPDLEQLSHESIPEEMGDQTIVSVGRLTYQKNIPLLIRVFIKLRKQQLCQLVIVGDGEELEAIQQMVEECDYRSDILLLGHRSNPFPYMKKAKVFALTSIYEGFGNVVVEALACGTPVVSTNCGGPEEILATPEQGLIINQNDESGFVKALSEKLKDESDPAALMNYARDNFSVDIATQEHLLLLQRII